MSLLPISAFLVRS